MARVLINVLCMIALVLGITSVFGCSNANSEATTDTMKIDTSDPSRAEGEFPNIPAIIHAIENKDWMDEHGQTHLNGKVAVEKLRITPTKDTEITENSETISGICSDLSESNSGFREANLYLRAEDILNSGEISLTISFDMSNPESFSNTINLDNGEIENNKTKQIIGKFDNEEVANFNNQMRIDNAPTNLIGFNEDDAFDLLEKLGIPRNTVSDVKQAYKREQTPDPIQHVLNGPFNANEDDARRIYGASSVSSYEYGMNGVYKQDNTEIYFLIIASQNRDVYRSITESSQYKNMNSNEMAAYSTNNNVRAIFSSTEEWVNDQNYVSKENASDGPDVEMSEIPFTDNDTYFVKNYDFGPVLDYIDNSRSSTVNASTANSESNNNGGSLAKVVDVPSSGYILPTSGEEYVTLAELSRLSDKELYIARNEIFARKGRMFNSQDLQDWFNAMPWYTPTYSPEDFDAKIDSLLNDIERGNIDTISEMEEYRKTGNFSN